MLHRTARRSLIVTSTVALFVGGLLGASPAQAAKPALQDVPITIVVPSETSTSRTVTVTYSIGVKSSANVQFICAFVDVAQETYFAYDCGTFDAGKKAVTGTVTHTVNGDGEFFFAISANAKGYSNTEVFDTFTVSSSGGGGGGGDPQTVLDLCNSLGGTYNSGAALPANLPAPFDNDQGLWNCTGLASGSLANADQTDYSATGQAFQSFCLADGGTRVLVFAGFPTPSSDTAWCTLEIA